MIEKGDLVRFEKKFSSGTGVMSIKENKNRWWIKNDESGAFIDAKPSQITLMTSKVNRENYRGFDAINYSLLSSLQKSPIDVKLSEEKDFSDGMMFGDATDIILFDGMKEFRKQYVVNDLSEAPSGKARKTIELAAEKLIRDEVDPSDHGNIAEAILVCADEVPYGKNWNDSTKIDKTIGSNNGHKFLELLIESKDKHVMTQSMYVDVQETVHTLQNHPFTKHFFADYTDSERFDSVNQLPILFPSGVMDRHGEEVMGKGLLDLVIVDHKNEYLYPIDLKTTGDNVDRFPYNFIRWNYYLQASYYSKGVSTWMEDTEGRYHEETPLDLIGRDISSYKVRPFQFVAISSKDTQKPIIYECTNEDLLAGKSGGTTRSGRPIMGYEQLIQDLLWHREQDQWVYRKSVFENNGKKDLNILLPNEAFEEDEEPEEEIFQ